MSFFEAVIVMEGLFLITLVHYGTRDLTDIKSELKEIHKTLNRTQEEIGDFKQRIGLL